MIELAQAFPEKTWKCRVQHPLTIVVSLKTTGLSGHSWTFIGYLICWPCVKILRQILLVLTILTGEYASLVFIHQSLFEECSFVSFNTRSDQFIRRYIFWYFFHCWFICFKVWLLLYCTFTNLIFDGFIFIFLWFARNTMILILQSTLNEIVRMAEHLIL